MSKSVTDKPLYIITKYIYYFFITNFYFVVCNILFFIVFILVDFVYENILLYYITLIPMGPSITALLSTMGKLAREKEVSPTSNYFKAYKANFLSTMKYWLIQLTIIFILLIDFNYSTNHSNILSPVFLILLIVSLFIMLYAFPIISRFEVKLKNLFIISIYSNFKYFKTTLINASTLIAFGFIFFTFPSVSFLFASSLIGFFIMFNLQGALEHMGSDLSKV